MATLKSTCTKSRGDIIWYPRSTVRVRQRREELSHNSAKNNRVHMRGRDVNDAGREKRGREEREGEEMERGEGEKKRKRKQDRGNRDLDFSFDDQERECQF